VRRNFALLRDLDTRAQELIDKVEKDTKSYLKNSKRPRDNEEEEQNIKSSLKSCIELSDEKVALAVQTYELVDKHIRRLDTDLKKFEAELEQQGGLTLKDLKAQQEKKPADNGKARKKTDTPDARVLNVDIDMPIDPNEPTYCICNRVSFGEMVGCDNAECKVEWFHFECVGLTHPPKGKWFCPDCTALRKKTTPSVRLCVIDITTVWYYFIL